jgi:hypothetical protein
MISDLAPTESYLLELDGTANHGRDDGLLDVDGTSDGTANGRGW